MNNVEIVHKPTMSEFRRMAEQLGYEKVKHARWMQDHGWYSHHCSNCGRSTSDYVREDGDWYDRVFDYCPNCGAKMDGDPV